MLRALEPELASLRWRARRVLEPGRWTVLVAAGVLADLGSLALPWTDGHAGWHVLAGVSPVGALPLLFAWSTALACAVAVLARLWARWSAGVVAFVASASTSLCGLGAIWSSQAHPQPTAAPGVVAATLTALLLTLTWLVAVLVH